MTKLAVEKREKRPRSILTGLRRKGRVPAVVYGKEMGNELIHLESSEMIRVLHQEGTSAVYELQFPDGKSRKVMIKELQKDRIKDRILHIDFKEIQMNEPVDAEVTIELNGEPKGVKEGGILNEQLRTVQIRCLPGEIPDRIEGDISHLDIGDSMMVHQLNIPDRMELLSDPEETVASVLPPTREETAVEEGEEANEGQDEPAEKQDESPDEIDGTES
ncbi:50S ribosomal protein L25/general stress protein Ctc [Melghirimyces algeriensis]|uniref:Large ribosomal subunit protein bL25 n=1 Tax=Melghirimyces algeriensis TaxID=910412 RepID=A0A521EBE0_9BACL|nr:50S ribosomal protein L25/general stress protein Ctc [Melghirimyces algeriensis]SMO81112.1 large subunit ribosomal protein L25 [Melghirimyces algeriensis]